MTCNVSSGTLNLTHSLTHSLTVQMDVRNLAIIFGPTLLQLRDDNLLGMVKDMSSQCQIVEAVVLHVSHLLLITTIRCGMKTQLNTCVHYFSKCWPIFIEIGVQRLGYISHTVWLHLFIYLKRLLRDTSFEFKAHIRIVPFQFVKNSYFKFLLGSVATLFRWSCKKIWSYFVANLSKTLHFNFYQNQSSIVDVMTKNVGVLFYAPLFTSVSHRESVVSHAHTVVWECCKDEHQTQWKRLSLPPRTKSSADFYQNRVFLDRLYLDWVYFDRLYRLPKTVFVAERGIHVLPFRCKDWTNRPTRQCKLWAELAGEVQTRVKWRCRCTV